MNEVLVSVDSSELQRTTLERKKSDELHTIAAALGVKPGSRAKKAEVVDLILSATRGGTISDAPSESSAGRSNPGAARSGRTAPSGAGRGASGGDAGSGATGPATDKSGATPVAADQSGGGTSTAANPDLRPEASSAKPAAGADKASSADNAETNVSKAAGAASTDEVEAAVQSGTRRRTPRSVGWAGDETGQPTPTDVVEPASLFDTPSAAEARSRAAKQASDESSSSNGATTQTSAESTDSKADAQQDNKSDGGDRGRNNRNNRNGGGASNEGGQRSEGDDSASAKQSGDGPKSGDGSNQNSDSNNNRNEGEGTGRRRRRRGRDRDRGENTNSGSSNSGNSNNNSRNDNNNRSDNNRNRNDREDGRERTEESSSSEPVPITGHLDLRDEGYGFLRINGFVPARDDAYVSVRQVRQFGLRKGDYLTGTSRPAGYKEKNPALLRIDTVNGVDPEVAKLRPRFEDLTPLFPDQKLTMEIPGDPTNMTARIIDLMSPIGKGQRGLIVSPPKAGKTTIMKHIARSIEVNNPEVHLIVLLVDERPEEVTDMKRWLTRGEVAASTFDRPAEEHIHVAELTIERAKRLVETGKDVCIILDGITRLARAYNLGAPASGRIMSGGIDTGALYPPKKFFGAARNIEEGGSLTVLATALVDTGSRMDEVIFEEFKGTGNMELRLDRRLAERRIYPAIDVDASSTRHEELLFERKQLQQVWKLRRVLSGLRGESGDGGAAAGLELLIDRLKTFKDNDEFLAEVAKGPTIG